MRGDVQCQALLLLVALLLLPHTLPKPKLIRTLLPVQHLHPHSHTAHLAPSHFMAPHPVGCACGDEDAHVRLEGTQDFLFDKIDRDKVVALNAEEGKHGKMVIRPWDEREQGTEVTGYRALLRRAQ